MSRFKKDVLKKVFTSHGFKLESLTSVRTGKFNQTYIGKVSNHSNQVELNQNKLVLRIAPSPDAGFVFYEENMMAREPGIHKIISNNTEIPIPEIYCYNNEHDLLDHDYLMMEYIEGVPLSEINLNDRQQSQLMEKTGSYLKELHDSCHGDRYGYPGNECMQQTSSWVTAFQVMWHKIIDDLEACGVYNKEEGILARKAFENNIKFFERDVSASLLHMDIWAQNILVDSEGGIRGIVDWDRALYGDPEIEFAVLDYCGFNNDDFWRGYGQKPRTDQASSIRRKFYHLYEVQKYPVIWTWRGGADYSRIQSYKQYALKELNTIKKMDIINE